MKKHERYVEEAMLESTSSYFDYSTTSLVSVSGERSAVIKISSIEKLVVRLAATDDIHFYIKPHRGDAKIAMTEIGRQFLVSLNSKEEIQRFYPIHDFSPFVKAFFESTEETVWSYGGVKLERLIGDLDVAIKPLNYAIARIRVLVREKNFKEAMNAHRRLSNKNYKSLIAYIDRIFENRSRVLVLRVDLGYSKLISDGHVRERQKFESVKADRERLLSVLRRKLPEKTILGHAWKLEYGLSKGYHYHCMFFLDGAKLREDVAWAREIGDIWVARITSGGGVYYNCNRRKGTYRSCGIGMIEHSDKEARKGLEKAALYLTKIEYYIKIVTDGRARTFGRGEMPKVKASKRGRPRRSPVDLISSALEV
jgi:hypothetical protein